MIQHWELYCWTSYLPCQILLPISHSKIQSFCWLPARWASGFSGDHQQNHQCLWFHSCYNVTHVFCPSLFVFCWEMKLLLLILTESNFAWFFLQAVNEDSLKKLNQYIDTLRNNARAIPTHLTFFVRETAAIPKIGRCNLMFNSLIPGKFE